ncbi:hypothetical protein Ancab_014252 [Ancistrocladus abbreviatus]
MIPICICGCADVPPSEEDSPCLVCKVAHQEEMVGVFRGISISSTNAGIGILKNSPSGKISSAWNAIEMCFPEKSCHFERNGSGPYEFHEVRKGYYDEVGEETLEGPDEGTSALGERTLALCFLSLGLVCAWWQVRPCIWAFYFPTTGRRAIGGCEESPGCAKTKVSNGTPPESSSPVVANLPCLGVISGKPVSGQITSSPIAFNATAPMHHCRVGVAVRIIAVRTGGFRLLSAAH